MLPEKAQAVVIGGGVVGAATAYFLAREGVEVLLLERADRAGQASAANAAWVWSLTRRPGIDLDLAVHSIGVHRRLQEELELDPEYRQRGGLLVATREAELEPLLAHAEARAGVGHPLEFLSPAQTWEKEPLLTDRVIGSLFCPESGSTNPIRLVLSLLEAASGLGARIVTGTGVRGIEVGRGRVRAVLTDKGRIRTGLVVNAAGAWAGEVGRMAGLKVPIGPYKMTMLVTEPLPPCLTRVVMGASYMIEEEAKGASTGEPAMGCALVAGQQVSGNLLLGATWHRVGFQRETTYEEITSIAAENRAFLPSLARVRVIRSFANFFPFTEDDLPILGPVKGVAGLIMAAGHNGHGICLGPGTGRLIQELITTGRPSLDLKDLSLSRFSR